MCLEGVWKVSGGCLEGVWRVSKGCLEPNSFIPKVLEQNYFWSKFFGVKLFGGSKFFGGQTNLGVKIIWDQN